MVGVLVDQDCVVVVLFKHRTVWLEYWLTQDCVVVALFQPRTVWLKYWLTQGFVCNLYCFNPGLCGWSTG